LFGELPVVREYWKDRGPKEIVTSSQRIIQWDGDQQRKLGT